MEIRTVLATACDICPSNADPDQLDTDQDGVGDACEILGCTDPGALNYNPAATEDDDSCLYDGTIGTAARSGRDPGNQRAVHHSGDRA